MNAAITARITTGIAVQISSRRVAPWICGPSAVRGRPRRRYLKTNAIRAPSTSTKIAPVKIEIQTYESLIRFAFGECGVAGAKPTLPAYATAASASAAPRASTRTRALRLTGGGILRDD